MRHYWSHDHYYIVSDIVLGVLTNAIRKEKDTRDLQIGEEQTKLLLFTVDVQKSNRNNRTSLDTNINLQKSTKFSTSATAN